MSENLDIIPESSMKEGFIRRKPSSKVADNISRQEVA